jgi:hypothetical protein
VLEEALVGGVKFGQGIGHTTGKTQRVPHRSEKGGPEQIKTLAAVMSHANPGLTL